MFPLRFGAAARDDRASRPAGAARRDREARRHPPRHRADRLQGDAVAARRSTTRSRPSAPASPPASICPRRPGTRGRSAPASRSSTASASTEMMHIFVSAAGDDIRPGSTGKAVPGYEATVLDADGKPMAEGVGRLAIKGPTGCRYLDDPRQARLCRRRLERHRRHLPPRRRRLLSGTSRAATT